MRVLGRRIDRRALSLAFGLLLACAGVTRADEAKPAPPPAADEAVLRKPVPQTLEDLRAIEKRVQDVVEKTSAATVNVRIGNAQGSGVIVTKEGHVLTAGHVVGGPKREVRLTLSDGREVRGITLGLDHALDTGMIKITDEGEWPFAGMAPDDSLSVGDWCVAVGHPNGYQKDRGAVVRLGRVIAAAKRVVQTDCTLVGGDSGGPLFDLSGRVVGIHSRIGAPTAVNLHVPVSAYRREWDALVKSEDIEPEVPNVVLGVEGVEGDKECRVARVAEGSGAARAGLKPDDVVTRFDGAKVDAFQSLRQLVFRRQPGDEVEIEVLRDGQTLRLKAVLGKRERKG